MSDNKMSDQIVFATEYSKGDYFTYENEVTKSAEIAAENENEKVETADTEAEDSGGILGVLSEYSDNTNFHGFRYIFAAYTIGGR
jgi:hypothetical protein